MTGPPDYTEYVRARLPWLRGLAFLLCGDWHRADDLVQTTLTRIFVRWSRIDHVRNIDGYVRTVLVRAFATDLRRRWSGVRLFADLPETEESAGDDVSVRVTVRAALLTVPRRQRATLLLRYYCDLSIADTAATLRCSEGTVKSQTARGLAALRRALDAAGDEPFREREPSIPQPTSGRKP